MPLPIVEIVDLALGVELLKIRSAPPPLGGGGEGGLNGLMGDAPFGYGGIAGFEHANALAPSNPALRREFID